MATKVHLRGLNGIRAIASLAVVISHIALNFENFGFSPSQGLDLAGFGVSMFFSLSGFLITYLLMIEKSDFGDVSIKDFYIRRILRIWPLYFFYLIVCILVIILTQPQELRGNITYYILLSGNIPFILGSSPPLIFHFWSLGVEEQFYLFWPWVMKRIGNPFKWISWFILIMLFLKLMGYVIYKKTGSYLLYDIVHVTRFHCMAFGALGAILWQRQVKWLRGLCFSNWVVSICWIILLLAGFNKFHFASVIDNELISIITVLLILNLSFGPKPLINLESWFLNFLGKISFGVYVYHPLLIFLLSYFLGSWIRSLEFNSRVIFVYFISVTATILLAAISYELLERPFLSMKDRFSKVLSAPNEKLNESTS